MQIIILIIQILAVLGGTIAALLSILLFVRLRWPAALWWVLKLYASALAPLFVLIGLICLIAGIISGSSIISLIGIYDILIFSMHWFAVTRPPVFSGSFEHAFGLHWEERLNPRLKKHFLAERTILRLPKVPEPRFEQDLVFSTIPDSGRELLCDIWQPPEDVTKSGLALVYLHGSAFYFLDKDFGTRPLFRHLAAQGHVIMDVAYRLFPETDVMGMVGDVNRALFWMRDNADRYGIDPGRIVLGGGSAGAHLALLAAYTVNDSRFGSNVREDQKGDVCGVLSLYGTSDFEALYYHTNQHLTTRAIPGRPKMAVPTKMPSWIIRRMGKDYHRLGMDKDFGKTGTLAPLLGGHPDECPETYALFSPVSHVHPGCPPTLLVHGEHDIMAPVASTRRLHGLLLEKDVPVIMHILPQTDHGFDLIVPKISPSAHNSIYDVERFLATFVEEPISEKVHTSA